MIQVAQQCLETGHTHGFDMNCRVVGITQPAAPSKQIVEISGLPLEKTAVDPEQTVVYLGVR